MSRGTENPKAGVQFPKVPLIVFIMKLILKRVARRPTYTIGKLYIDDKYFCDTLEDTDRRLNQSISLSDIRRIKVQNRTAIPIGTYKIIVNRSPKFKRLLPRLLDVPGFDGILIHRGNTDKDTSGCILVGENKIVGKVINSTNYELSLVKTLTEVQNKGESIEIEIQ